MIKLETQHLRISSSVPDGATKPSYAFPIRGDGYAVVGFYTLLHPYHHRTKAAPNTSKVSEIHKPDTYVGRLIQLLSRGGDPCPPQCSLLPRLHLPLPPPLGPAILQRQRQLLFRWAGHEPVSTSVWSATVVCGQPQRSRPRRHCVRAQPNPVNS